MENRTPPLNSPQGALDLDFLPRVYRTSLVVIILVGGIIWEGPGAKSALAWFAGSLLSLLGVFGTEYTVRRYINPDAKSVKGLIGASCLKLVLMGALVLATFWAALNHFINPLWTIPGFAVPHLVIVLKLAGRKVLAWSRSSREPR